MYCKRGFVDIEYDVFNFFRATDSYKLLHFFSLSLSSAIMPRIALAVQCEGNGHFTQALGIAASLREHLGLEVACVILNERKRATVPAHFLARFAHVPNIYVDGPVMVREGRSQALDKVGMVWHNLTQAGQFLGSLNILHTRMTELGIDTIINLFEGLLVCYMQHFRPRHILCINVATQFRLYVQCGSTYVGRKRVEVPHQHALLTDMQAAQAFVVLDAYVRLHTLPILPAPTVQFSIQQGDAALTTTTTETNQPFFIRTATVALCPFPPILDSAVPFGHPATWLLPLPRLADASLHAAPCFVSYADLQTHIVPVEHMVDASQRALQLALQGTAPGVVRLVGYVNVPTFSDELIQLCIAANAPPASVNSPSSPLAWLQQLAQPFFPLLPLGVVPSAQQQVPAQAQAQAQAQAPPPSSLPSFHLFLFRRQEQDVVHLLPNLTCFRLDRRNFLSCMNACDGYVSTAGVESVCEAVVLQKPVLVVPGRNDEEQYMNALTFAQHLEGVFARTNFVLDDLLAYIQQHRDTRGRISSTYANECMRVRAWLDTNSSAFANLFQHLCNQG
jgi:hypothetical protein